MYSTSARTDVGLEKFVDQSTGSPSIYLVASAPEARNPTLEHSGLGHSRLTREAAVKLEECRSLLVACGQDETVRLLDIALLQLRMQLSGVSEADLKALCAAMTHGAPARDQLCDADGR